MDEERTANLGVKFPRPCPGARLPRPRPEGWREEAVLERSLSLVGSEGSWSCLIYLENRGLTIFKFQKSAFLPPLYAGEMKSRLMTS